MKEPIEEERIWPYLIYDQWAAALHQALREEKLAVDFLDAQRFPNYDALFEGDHRGIIFGQGDADASPERTEAIFQRWLQCLQPESPFDLDLLAESVARDILWANTKTLWEDYQGRITRSKTHPIRHPARIEAVLAETRGYVFYRDQPERVLAIVLAIGLDEVGPLIKRREELAFYRCHKESFCQCLWEWGVAGQEVQELWDVCTGFYPHTKTRPFISARRAQIYWALTVRRRHPKLFKYAWEAFVKGMT